MLGRMSLPVLSETSQHATIHNKPQVRIKHIIEFTTSVGNNKEEGKCNTLPFLT